mgnify:CR=1 FL=1
MGYQSVVVTKDAAIGVAKEPELDLHIDLMADAHLGNFTDTIYDPITKTVFMRPRQFESGWTPSSVIAFTASDPTNWETIAVGAAANTYMMSKNASATAPATASQSANQPFVCSFFVYGQSGAVGTYLALTLTFGGLTMNIYSNGLCVIGTQSGFLTAGYAQGQAGYGNICNRWVRLLIMPINRTGVLFYSDLGGAWIYNEYADAAATDNTLLSAATFTFSAPGSKALFQLQHALFKTTGTFVSKLYDLNYSPGIGHIVTATAKEDSPSGAACAMTVVDNTGTAYVPDGSLHEVAGKFAFTGDGTGTSLLYAGDINIEGERASKSLPAPTTIAVVGAGAEVFDIAVSADQYKRLMAWESVSPVTGVHSYRAVDGSGNEILVVPAAMPDQDQSSTKVTPEGLQTMLKAARFYSPWRMDGMDDTDVLEKCFRVAGIEDARMSLGAPTAMPGDPRGKLTYLPVAAGTSVIDAIQMLLSLRPAHELNLELSGASVVLKYDIPPTTGTAAVTLYADDLHSQEIGAVWIPGAVFQYQPLTNIKWRNRANDGGKWNGIMVVGRTVDGLAITSSVQDALAIDPATPAEITSAGCFWFGAPVTYVCRDNRLCTQTQCDNMRDWLSAQYCIARQVVQFDGIMHNQLCHNSIVELVAEDELSSELYRILTIERIDGTDYNETEYGAVRYTAEWLPQLA